MEQFNFRYAEPDDFEVTPSFASIDVSFISLDLILPALHRILADHGQVVALVKPQFEAGREQIGKHGIVKDPKVHLAVLEKVATFAGEHGFSVMGMDYILSHRRMGEFVNLTMVPGTAPLVKRRLRDIYKNHIFSIVADDDTILILAHSAPEAENIIRSIFGW